MLTGLTIIDQRHTTLPSPPVTVPTPNLDIQTLKRQLSEQQTIISEQSRLLEMSLNSDYYIPSRNDEIVDDAFEITSSELDKRESLLGERERGFAGARRAFTEAAVKLGFERVSLQVNTTKTNM
jgi:hypothetical protein